MTFSTGFMFIQSDLLIQIYNLYIFCMTYIHVVRGLTLYFLLIIIYVLTHLLTGAFIDLLLICPNHLNRLSLILSSTMPNLARIFSLLILSFLVLPHVYCNICVSATLIFCSFCFLVAQHSLQYNKPGRNVVL